MITLKVIQTSLTSTNSHYCLLHPRKLPSAKTCFVSFCTKSNDSNPEPSPPEGDTRKQDLLARIAMLQTQKVRLTDYLDERSAYLTQFAEEANAEFDKIGEDALKELDQASARVCFQSCSYRFTRHCNYRFFHLLFFRLAKSCGSWSNFSAFGSSVLLSSKCRKAQHTNSLSPHWHVQVSVFSGSCFT